MKTLLLVAVGVTGLMGIRALAFCLAIILVIIGVFLSAMPRSRVKAIALFLPFAGVAGGIVWRFFLK